MRLKEKDPHIRWWLLLFAGLVTLPWPPCVAQITEGSGEIGSGETTDVFSTVPAFSTAVWTDDGSGETTDVNVTIYDSTLPGQSSEATELLSTFPGNNNTDVTTWYSASTGHVGTSDDATIDITDPFTTEAGPSGQVDLSSQLYKFFLTITFNISGCINCESDQILENWIKNEINLTFSSNGGDGYMATNITKMELPTPMEMDVTFQVLLEEYGAQALGNGTDGWELLLVDYTVHYQADTVLFGDFIPLIHSLNATLLLLSSISLDYNQVTSLENTSLCVYQNYSDDVVDLIFDTEIKLLDDRCNPCEIDYITFCEIGWSCVSSMNVTQAPESCDADNTQCIQTSSDLSTDSEETQPLTSEGVTDSITADLTTRVTSIPYFSTHDVSNDVTSVTEISSNVTSDTASGSGVSSVVTSITELSASEVSADATSTTDPSTIDVSSYTTSTSIVSTYVTSPPDSITSVGSSSITTITVSRTSIKEPTTEFNPDEPTTQTTTQKVSTTPSPVTTTLTTATTSIPQDGQRPPSFSDVFIDFLFSLILTLTGCDEQCGQRDSPLANWIKRMLEDRFGSKNNGFKQVHITDMTFRKRRKRDVKLEEMVNVYGDDAVSLNDTETVWINYEAVFEAESILSSDTDEVEKSLHEVLLSVSDITLDQDNRPEDVGKVTGGASEEYNKLIIEMVDDAVAHVELVKCNPCNITGACGFGYECIVLGNEDECKDENNANNTNCVYRCFTYVESSGTIGSEPLCDKSQLCHYDNNSDHFYCSCKENYLSAVGTDSYCIHKHLVIGLSAGLGSLLILIIIFVCIVTQARRWKSKTSKLDDSDSLYGQGYSSKFGSFTSMYDYNGKWGRYSARSPFFPFMGRGDTSLERRDFAVDNPMLMDIAHTDAYKNFAPQLDKIDTECDLFEKRPVFQVVTNSNPAAKPMKGQEDADHRATCTTEAETANPMLAEIAQTNAYKDFQPQLDNVDTTTNFFENRPQVKVLEHSQPALQDIQDQGAVTISSTSTDAPLTTDGNGWENFGYKTEWSWMETG